MEKIDIRLLDPKISKPIRAVFFRPILSEIGPKNNWPAEIPKKTEVIVQCP